MLTRLFGNAYLLLAIAALAWAGNAVAGKFAAGVITPITLTFLRWVFASILIFYLAAPHLHRDLGTLQRHWKRVFALGGLGFAAFNLLLYAALTYTSAINVTIEQSAMPVVIMLLNFVAFHQRLRALQVLGVVVSIVGVIITATRGDPLALLGSGMNRGDAIMMLAVALYAGYAVGLRFKPAVHWLSLLFAMALSALVFSTPFFVYEVIATGFHGPSVAGWVIVLYVTLLPSLVAQLFFLRGVELIGSNRAGLFINLVPIFGALLAVLMLGETFEDYHLLGLVLVLGGITAAERFRA